MYAQKKRKKTTGQNEVDVTCYEYVLQWTLEVIKFWWHLTLIWPRERFFWYFLYKNIAYGRTQKVKNYFEDFDGILRGNSSELFLRFDIRTSPYLSDGGGSTQIYAPLGVISDC